MISCMGGWCHIRDTCRRHTMEIRSLPIERLCEQGETDAYEMIETMKNLSVQTHRCRGYDGKTGETCRHRSTCERHLQLERDRELQLPQSVVVPCMQIGYVPGNACHYRMPAR